MRIRNDGRVRGADTGSADSTDIMAKVKRPKQDADRGNRKERKRAEQHFKHK